MHQSVLILTDNMEGGVNWISKVVERFKIYVAKANIFLLFHIANPHILVFISRPPLKHLCRFSFNKNTNSNKAEWISNQISVNEFMNWLVTVSVWKWQYCQFGLIYSHYLLHNEGTEELAINNPTFADEVLPLLEQKTSYRRKRIWWSLLTIH